MESLAYRPHWRGVLKRGGPPRASKRMVAVDIETHGLGGEFAGGAWVAEGEGTVTFFRDVQEWVDAIFSTSYRSCVWFAHNGGEYDFKYLVPYLLKIPNCQVFPIVQGQDRVIGFRILWQRRVIELRDSFALMPASLAKLTEQLAPEYRKKEFDHETTTFDMGNPEHRQYLSFDVLGLRACLVAFHTLIRRTFHTDCGWTAGATALRAWRGTIPPNVYYYRQPAFVREFCRQAYVGGMVALRDTEWHEDVVSLDVNAMYPHAMLQGVPSGCATFTRQWEGDDVPGIYHVQVSIPLHHRYPMAPMRDRTAGTIWPVGTFDTYMTSMELLDVRQFGVTWTVIEGVVFDRIAYPFQAFVHACEEIETRHPGTALAAVVKIMRNSLYGKFGAREEATEWQLCADDTPLDASPMWSPLTDSQSGELVPNLWWRPKRLDTAYLHPEWAAWITSRARILNRRNAAVIGFQYWLYTDTDNNKMQGDAARAAIADGRIAISRRYGDSKVEASYTLFRASGPKFYIGECVGGELDVKVKGIPRSLHRSGKLLDALDSPDKVEEEFVSMHGTLQMLKRGAPRSSLRKRSYPRLVKSTHWRVVGTDVLPLAMTRGQPVEDASNGPPGSIPAS